MNDKDIMDRSVKRWDNVDETETETDGDDAEQDEGKPRMPVMPLENGSGWMNDEDIMDRSVKRWADGKSETNVGEVRMKSVSEGPDINWMNHEEVMDRSVKRWADVEGTEIETATGGDDAEQDEGKPLMPVMPLKNGVGWMNGEDIMDRSKRWADGKSETNVGEVRMKTVSEGPDINWMNDKEIMDRSKKRWVVLDETETETATGGDDAEQDEGKPRMPVMPLENGVGWMNGEDIVDRSKRWADVDNAETETETQDHEPMKLGQMTEQSNNVDLKVANADTKAKVEDTKITEISASSSNDKKQKGASKEDKTKGILSQIAVLETTMGINHQSDLVIMERIGHLERVTYGVVSTGALLPRLNALKDTLLG